MSEVDFDWDDWDWEQAFAVAGYEVAEFRELVAEVLAEDAGCNDGPNWIAAFRLSDGRYAMLSAWCDYTGWDCQAGGSMLFADTLGELCRMHMGEEERQRLGFDVFGQRVEPG